MRTSRKPRTSAASLALALALASVGLSGCGYCFRPPFDKSVRTVFVPIFKSQTFRRDLNLNLNELLCKEIEKRTPYKVVGVAEGADTIIEGMVNFDQKNTVVENPYNLPRQSSMSLNVSVNWTRNPPTEEEKKRGFAVVAETVNFAPELGETTLTAIYAANQRIATQIVDMMEQQWFAGPGKD